MARAGTRPVPAPRSLPEGTVVTRQNTPGAITPTERHVAGLNTVANVALPALGGAGGVGMRVAANAGLGALNSEDGERIRGATAGALVGEVLHHTLHGALKAKGALDYGAGMTEAGAEGLREMTPRAAPVGDPLDQLIAQHAPATPAPSAASAEPEGGVEYRHTWLGCCPNVPKAKTFLRGALVTPYAARRERTPGLSRRCTPAGARRSMPSTCDDRGRPRPRGAHRRAAVALRAKLNADTWARRPTGANRRHAAAQEFADVEHQLASARAQRGQSSAQATRSGNQADAARDAATGRPTSRGARRAGPRRSAPRATRPRAPAPTTTRYGS